MAQPNWTGIIPKFKSTSFGKAFVLNAIVAGMSTAITVELRFLLNPVLLKKDYDEGVKFAITLAISFMSSFFTYGIMFALFGYGSGMLSGSSTDKRVDQLQKQIQQLSKQFQ
ncbi:MAG: hypothetical protein K0U52_07420 [Gammaproteobacteria bacterium]|nr:hypothetical protein [Gammaproteobacteria bacterium]